jgi:hypothetical protein
MTEDLPAGSEAPRGWVIDVGSGLPTVTAPDTSTGALMEGRLFVGVAEGTVGISAGGCGGRVDAVFAVLPVAAVA